MKVILNRMAWVLSFSIGYPFASYLIDLGFGGERVFVLRVILTAIIAPIIKRVIISKDFIETELAKHEQSSKKEIIHVVTENNASLDVPLEVEIPNELKENEIQTESSKNDFLKESNYAETIIAEPLIEHLESGHLELEKTNLVDEKSFVESEKTPNFFQAFFAENVLAKVGGILLFLGVLFLLKLVYSFVGPVGKLCTGFFIGFTIFGTGVFLDKKNFKNQSRILFGTGILINYLVILSGRYLIGDNSFTDNMFLNEGVTFFLLVLNTLFAVAASVVYRSHDLLFFSFVTAYLNPFLIGAKLATTPFTLVGYGMAISIGAIAICNFYKKEKNHFILKLLNASFLGGNVLFLIAPFDHLSGWLIKLGATGILTLVIIQYAYKLGQAFKLGWYFLIGYFFLIFQLSFANLNQYNSLGSTFSLIGIFIVLFFFLFASVKIFKIESLLLLFGTMFMPLVIILGLVFGHVLRDNQLIFVLIGSIGIYLALFVFISTKLLVLYQYLFFGILGIFQCIISLFLSENFRNIFGLNSYNNRQELTATLAIIISAFVFQFSTYFFSTRKNLQYLYSMGTAMGIWLLLSVINRNERIFLSISSVAVFMLLNLVMPFINKELLVGKIRSLIIGLIMGVIFTVATIFFFGEKYYSGLGLGLSFLLLAMLYFGTGYAIYMQLQKSSKNNLFDIIFPFLGISISLFSLAIAFVFSKHSDVVSAIWIFEACVVLFFYQKNKDIKIYIAGLILMAIGFIKLLVLYSKIEQKEFLSLIPIGFIFMSFVLILKFLESEIRLRRWFHDVLHLYGIIQIGVLLVKIIPSHGHGLAFIGIGVTCVLLSFVYTRFYSHKIVHIFSGSLILFFALQIIFQDKIHNAVTSDNLKYLYGIQYFVSFLFGLTVFIFNRYIQLKQNDNSPSFRFLPLILNLSFAFYLFVITSIYVYFLVNKNEFFLTIYWGFLTICTLGFGINKNKIRWRTLGLYILTLTVLKILCYDIWQQFDQALIRILALMFVGAMMIGISIIYEKRLNGNLKGDFLPKNLF